MSSKKGFIQQNLTYRLLESAIEICATEFCVDQQSVGPQSAPIASPNFRLMLSFLFVDLFHQSEVARPYSWQVKKLDAVSQKV